MTSRTSLLLRPRRRGGPSPAPAARWSCAASPTGAAALPVVVPGFVVVVVVVGGGATAGAGMVVWGGRSSCFGGTCRPRRRRPRSLALMSLLLLLAISDLSWFCLFLNLMAWVVVSLCFCFRLGGFSWCCCAVLVPHLHCPLQTLLNLRIPPLKKSHPHLLPRPVVVAVSSSCARFLASPPVMTQVVLDPFPQFWCKWL